MPTHRTIYEQPDGWQHLQHWFERNNDSLRPWNVSAISRHVRLPQAVVRSLLTAPKGAEGMSRTGFTQERLRLFQRLFRRYGYRVQIPEQSPGVTGPCRPVPQLMGVHLQPYTYAQ
ncbi:hypothetical protein LGH70_22975 [Hymenobacter sp. BT635]|uniref:HTH araC/xylS-type domain-containing protein n=1 Tax=Hymenobacter nitidus TaxID=2880929 RepID=A0ABS8AJ69_9BACT|nr:hypothetical protein [Hymenobacter nitidus]MCB2380475.1 hypothetical protein [Hymenobacter nitidus]